MFIDEITYLSTHAHINPDFFTLLRYTVANDNGFVYCIELNRAFLLDKGYTLEHLHALKGTKGFT